MSFLVKKIDNKNIKEELNNVGFDKNYLEQGVLKHKFLNLKICNLTPVQATIIKQTALSLGCDSAVHRDVLTSRIENSNCVLSGSISQLKKVSEKLKRQPFSLSKLSILIDENLEDDFKKTQIMAILNLSENSFSGFSFDPKDDIEKFLKLGVDIIDIGAESTSPNSKMVDDDVQIQKLSPILDILKDKNVLVSVDTRSSVVADFAIRNGADIINDVSFLSDENMADVIIESGKKLILTHSKGTPETMDNLCDYKNVTDEVYFDLNEKINDLEKKGLSRENIIVDVGFGFAKNVEQNFELIKNIEQFKSLKCKLLAGTSRKRVLRSLIDNENKENLNLELDFLTAISSFYFAQKNIDILRVHNPYLTKLALNFQKLL
ncbi:MAG: dihydropteroate synthase [Cyanobacteria bacterium SIG30]|nr:dihydropteroate synthase [Cyanobacteria bacterium SIG30]